MPMTWCIDLDNVVIVTNYKNDHDHNKHDDGTAENVSGSTLPPLSA